MTLAVYDAGAAGVGGARSVMLRGLAPMVRDGAAQVWIDLAFEGTWHGHRAGSFTFSREVFATIVANFRRNPNPIPLDYEHATEHAIPAPASGWVQDVEVRDIGGVAHLYALVELTDEAAQWVREGRYRFSSAVVDFASRDLASGDDIGAELLSIALTNVPFIRGQAPIRLSRAASLALSGDTMKIKKSDFLSRLRKIEGDEVSVDQITKLAQSMGLLDEAMTGGGSEEPAEEAELAAETEEPAAMSAALSAQPSEPVAAAADAPPPETPAEGGPEAEATSLLEQAMQATGMDLAALVEALKAMMGTEPASIAPLSAKVKEQALLLSAHSASIKTLSARAETAEAEVARYRDKEASEAVDVLVDSGRILDNARDDFKALYLSNRAAFDRMSAALPEVVPVGEHASAHTPPTVETPAIDESDPFVKQRRRLFANTWLTRAQQDDAIRRDLKARNSNGVRV